MPTRIQDANSQGGVGTLFRPEALSEDKPGTIIVLCCSAIDLNRSVEEGRKERKLEIASPGTRAENALCVRVLRQSFGEEPRRGGRITARHDRHVSEAAGGDSDAMAQQRDGRARHGKGDRVVEA